MPRYVLPMLVLAVIVIALTLTWLTLGRSSPDTTIAEEDVAPFHRVEVSGAAEVVLQKGASEHVSVETPARGLRVVAQVRGPTLVIDARDNRRWWSSIFGRGGARTVRVTITYRALDSVTLSGAVKLQAAGLDTPELRLEASGGSSVRLDGLHTARLRVNGSGALKAEVSGEAAEQNVSISGAGEYNAERLTSTDAKISVSGVGHVVVRVDKTLSASISGAGSIEYYGNPEVKERVSGVGRVRRREARIAEPPHWHVASWHARGTRDAAMRSRAAWQSLG
jgi:hypothetical protein